MADAQVKPFIDLPTLPNDVKEQAPINSLKATHPNFAKWYSDLYELAKQAGEANENSDIWHLKFNRMGRVYRDLLTEIGINDDNRKTYSVLIKYIEYVLENAKSTNELLPVEEEDILNAIRGFMPEKDMATLKIALERAQYSNP